MKAFADDQLWLRRQNPEHCDQVLTWDGHKSNLIRDLCNSAAAEWWEMLKISNDQMTLLRQGRSKGVQPCPDHHWIEIELFDSDDKRVSGEAWSVELPDGGTITGSLDADGWARVDYVGAAGDCAVSFPNLDRTEWTAHRASPLEAKRGY